MTISLVWWNTSLSPAGAKRRSGADSRTVVSAMTKLLANELSIDLIGLAEVNRDDITDFRNADLSDFEIVDATSSLARSSFGLCVLFRASKLKLVGSKRLSVSKGNRNLKLGHRLDFALPAHEKILHIIFSHWPSRLWTEADHVDRHLLAVRLRDSVDEILSTDENANIILAGDYNDEPFDRSLSEQLMATRDRQLAASKRHLFYNPFWRHLVYKPSDEAGGGKAARAIPSYAGTYFHQSGAMTKWRTFDQFMFSSALLGSSDWELDESRTSVVNVPSYTTLVLDRSNGFDHLPVMSALRRRRHG